MAGSIVIRRLSSLVTSGVVDRLTMDAYPEDEEIIWDRIMARVVGADCTLIEIGARRGQSDYPMCSEKVTNVGTSVQMAGALQGSGGYKLYAEFTGTTIGEMLEMTAFGVRELKA